MTRNLSDAQRLLEGSIEVECRGNDNPTDLGDWYRIKRVGNIRARPNLQAALPQSHQKVVRHRDTGCRIAGDISRADNGANETTAAGLADDEFTRPLGLPVACSKTLTTAFQVVRLRDRGFSSGHPDVVLAV